MAAEVKRTSTPGSYLQYILAPAINGWWALITGIIGLIGWVATPNDVVPLNKVVFLVLIIVTSFSFIVGVSVLYRGWKLYAQKKDKIVITEIVQHDNERIFLLSSFSDVRIGAIYELYRKQESVEVPIGFIEAAYPREDGMIQARAVWILPGHLRDIETGSLSVQNLAIQRTPSKEMLARWIDEQTEVKLQELLKRGGK